MNDWNVVISVYQDGFRRALRALKEYGSVERSPYYNVLVMRVKDPTALLEAIERKAETNTALYDAISRVAPAMRTIDFHSIEEFEEKITPILIEWLPQMTEVPFTRDCIDAEIGTACERRTSSACLTICSSMQWRRKAHNAESRSQNLMPSS